MLFILLGVYMYLIDQKQIIIRKNKYEQKKNVSSIVTRVIMSKNDMLSDSLREKQIAHIDYAKCMDDASFSWHRMSYISSPSCTYCHRLKIIFFWAIKPCGYCLYFCCIWIFWEGDHWLCDVLQEFYQGYFWSNRFVGFFQINSTYDSSHRMRNIWAKMMIDTISQCWFLVSWMKDNSP